MAVDIHCEKARGEERVWEIEHNLGTTNVYVDCPPITEYETLVKDFIDIDPTRPIIEILDENTVRLILSEPFPPGWEVTVVG